jgi:hypothetical protein
MDDNQLLDDDEDDGAVELKPLNGDEELVLKLDDGIGELLTDEEEECTGLVADEVSGLLLKDDELVIDDDDGLVLVATGELLTADEDCGAEDDDTPTGEGAGNREDRKRVTHTISCRSGQNMMAMSNEACVTDSSWVRWMRCDWARWTKSRKKGWKTTMTYYLSWCCCLGELDWSWKRTTLLVQTDRQGVQILHWGP